VRHTVYSTYSVCYWILDECKNFWVYIVIGSEISRWRHCTCLVEVSVTKTTDGLELACEFDREVNYVRVYILYTKHCSHNVHMIM